MKFSTTILAFSLVFGIHCQESTNKDFIKSEFKSFPKLIRADVNFRKAYSFFLEDEFDSTLVYSHNFLASHLANDKFTNYCHYFRGASFTDKKLFSKAQEEYNKIPKSFPLNYAVMMKKGAIALELEEFSKAFEYFLEVREFPKHELKKINKGELYHNLGLCYLHLNDFESAEECLTKSLKLREKENDTTMLIASYMNIGSMYYNQYMDDLAIPLFEKAYNLSKVGGDFEVKQNAALNMAVVDEERKNYLQSIKYRKEYEQWRDSLKDQTKIWAVAQSEKKFISEQKQKEIEILEKDNSVQKAQRNTFIYSSVLLFILVMALLYFYRSKRKVNKVILVQKAMLDALNDTKDRLFSIVSHDLRSNVNALDKNNSELSESLEIKDYTEVKQQVEQGSALTNSTKAILDNMLNWALLQTEQMYFLQENLSLRSIVNQVTHNYEPLMNSKAMTLKIGIETNVFVYADLESLKIVLRNVMDNAIKFCDADDQISIHSTVESKMYCQLIIEDTGSGMSEESLTQLLDKTIGESTKINQARTGLGLHLCQAMMKKNEGGLNIESEENVGTKLILSIPLAKDYE